MISTKTFEGLRLKVYVDTTGHKTIGYGHNLDSPASPNRCKLAGLNHEALLKGFPITVPQADRLYTLDMEQAEKDVRSLVKDFDSHPPEVQDILKDLSFNMGKGTLSTFHNTLKAFNEHNYSKAASGLVASKWYRQVKTRGKIITKILFEMN